jgi:hypothetical protein
VKYIFILPIIYICIGSLLLFAFGAGGHGWGIDAVYYISLPAARLAENKDSIVLWWLLLGTVQYAAIGFLVGRFVGRK